MGHILVWLSRTVVLTHKCLSKRSTGSLPINGPCIIQKRHLEFGCSQRNTSKCMHKNNSNPIVENHSNRDQILRPLPACYNESTLFKPTTSIFVTPVPSSIFAPSILFVSILPFSLCSGPLLACGWIYRVHQRPRGDSSVLILKKIFKSVVLLSFLVFIHSRHPIFHLVPLLIDFFRPLTFVEQV